MEDGRKLGFFGFELLCGLEERLSAEGAGACVGLEGMGLGVSMNSLYEEQKQLLSRLETSKKMACSIENPGKVRVSCFLL